MLNGYEIILIMTLALIFFGAKKLPELARGLGQGIREFKKASREVTNEFENIVDSDGHSPKPMVPPPRPIQAATQEAAPASPPQDATKVHSS